MAHLRFAVLLAVVACIGYGSALNCFKCYEGDKPAGAPSGDVASEMKECNFNDTEKAVKAVDCGTDFKSCITFNITATSRVHGCYKQENCTDTESVVKDSCDVCSEDECNSSVSFSASFVAVMFSLFLAVVQLRRI